MGYLWKRKISVNLKDLFEVFLITPFHAFIIREKMGKNCYDFIKAIKAKENSKYFNRFVINGVFCGTKEKFDVARGEDSEIFHAARFNELLSRYTW